MGSTTAAGFSLQNQPVPVRNSVVGLLGMESSLCTYPCSEALPTGGRKHVWVVKMQCDDRKCGPTAQPAVLGDVPVAEDLICLVTGCYIR